MITFGSILHLGAQVMDYVQTGSKEDEDILVGKIQLIVNELASHSESAIRAVIRNLASTARHSSFFTGTPPSSAGHP